MNKYCLILALFLTVNASASELTKYIILAENGIQAGYQTVERFKSGLIKVDFDFKENGRGPSFIEKIRLNRDGTLREFELHGSTEMGSSVYEEFLIEGGVAKWNSPSDRGSTKKFRNAFYLPVNSSWEINSLSIGALGKLEGKELSLLPVGFLRQEVIDRAMVKKGLEKRQIELLMHTGIGLSPQFFWATTGKNPRLFAALIPGYSLLIESGWEENLPLLTERQHEASRIILLQRAKDLQHPLKGVTLIRNARIFNSITASLMHPSDIYMEGGRIQGIYSLGEGPELFSTEINAGGKVVLPGLFDMHAHVNRWSGAYSLAAGVTTVRDLGNSNQEVLSILNEIDRGQLLSPQVIPAGFIEGHSDYSSYDGIMIHDLAGAKKAIDWYRSHGYGHIKIYNSFPKEILAETVQYAHQSELTVGGHVPAFMTAKEAIEQGFDEINHINQLLLTFLVGPDTDTRTLQRFYLPAEKIAALDFDSDEVTAFIQTLKDKKIVIDPTLAGMDFIRQRDGQMAEPYKAIEAHLPPDVSRSFRVGTMHIPDDETAYLYGQSYQKMVEFVGLLYRNGVSIIAGSDALPGFTLHSELALYVQAGLTPSEAIQIATLNAARISKTDKDKGSIEPGKISDLIIMDADPTTNINNIRRVSLVIAGDKLIYPTEINRAIGVRPFTEIAPMAIKNKQVIKGEKVTEQTAKPIFN